jgi:hypothetical protein
MHTGQATWFFLIPMMAIATAFEAKCGNGPFKYRPLSPLPFDVFQLVGGSVTMRADYNVTEGDHLYFWRIENGSSRLNDRDIQRLHRNGVFQTRALTLVLNLLNETFDGIQVGFVIVLPSGRRIDGGVVSINIGGDLLRIFHTAIGLKDFFCLAAPVVTLVRTEYCKNTISVCANFTGGKPAPSLSIIYMGQIRTIRHYELHPSWFCVTLNRSSEVTNSRLTSSVTNCFGTASVTTPIIMNSVLKSESCQTFTCLWGQYNTRNCSPTFAPALSFVSNSPTSLEPETSGTPTVFKPDGKDTTGIMMDILFLSYL